MAGSSPTPLRPRPQRRPALALAVALTALVAGLGLWLAGGAAPAAAAGPCELGDFVWHDRNGNSLQDDAEEGVPGIEVTLLDADEQPVGVDPVVTDAEGRYRFDDLACGTYVVKFDATAIRGSLTGTKKGDDRARDSDPATRGFETNIGWTDPVVLTEDDPSDLTVDAGILAEFPECSIGDLVWSDENGNGIQDEGEPGIPNVVILLLDAHGEPSGYDPAVSDAEGRYSFPAITCGYYALQFRIPTGAEVTRTQQGDDPTVDSDIEVRDFAPSLAFANVAVGEGEDPADRRTVTVDAGFVLPDESVPPQCWIGDFVWGDADGDGIQDSGERVGFAQRVELIDAGGTVDTTSHIDSNGKYLLVADCGTYRVRFSDLVKGYEFTEQHAGDDARKDSDADPKTGLTDPVTVTAKTSYDRTVDVGVRKIGTGPSPSPTPTSPTPTAPPGPGAEKCRISGVVWNDADRDGFRDDGEDAFQGVRVALLDGDGDTAVRTLTDESGRYTLTATCGTYRVRFSLLPDGYEFASPASGLTGPVTLSAEKPDLTRNAAAYSPTGELPDTGADVRLGWLLGGAATMITAGGLLLITRRRRLG